MKLKVCGMKYVENIKQVAVLQPDYLGFIFYDKSKRNFEGIIPDIPRSIKKVGVFVNEYPEIVISLVEEYQLDAIQLHGDESVDYIKELQHQLAQRRTLFIEENKLQKKKKNKQYVSDKEIEIIKVFGIKDDFNFEVLQPYQEEVDFFLFDTKGKERGGNGITFDWSVLTAYPYSKPFFLSGGIGVEQLEEIHKIRKTDLPIYALDVNSRFETKVGLKSVEKLKKFKKDLAGF